MLINKLEVVCGKTSEVIREITFKKGVNIIIDRKLKAGEKGESNSIGKTTSLRAIDFCLGAQSAQIFYRDSEKNVPDENVKNFLEFQDVFFRLSLSRNDGRELILERGINNYFKINGLELSNWKNYVSALQGELFYIQAKNPSARQLLSKFLRYKGEAAEKTFKFLNQNAQDKTYELVFSILFHSGISPEFLERKSKLTKKIADLEKKRKALMPQGKTLKSQNELIRITKDGINKLENQKEKFQLEEKHKNLSEELGSINKRLEEANSKAAAIRYKLKTLRKNKEDLLNSISKIPVDVLKSLYDQANSNLPVLKTKFEELLGFHESMISDRMELINENINFYEKHLPEIEQEVSAVSKEKSKLLSIISKQGGFKDYDQINESLFTKYQKLGELEKLIKLVDEVDKGIKESALELKDIEKEIDKSDIGLNDNICQFNNYFSEISQSLYDENYVFGFEYNKKKGYRTFGITSENQNVGHGRKKGETMCFDWAYIKFLDHIGLDFPQFVLYDGIEDIDSNKIDAIYKALNKTSGQFIWALLREKADLVDPNFIEQHTVLELAKDNKFFRIENRNPSKKWNSAEPAEMKEHN
ncbi:MAG: DUF2326 domain-containing protein [Cytophagales bacterium]|nr:DUF2326 domain-containing protein [Cytophagales bacterium]